MLGNFGTSSIGKFVNRLKGDSSGSLASKTIDECTALLDTMDSALTLLEVQTKGPAITALRDRHTDLVTALKTPNPKEAEFVLQNIRLLQTRMDAAESALTEDVGRLAVFKGLITLAKRESDEVHEDIDDADNEDLATLNDAAALSLLADTQLFSTGELDSQMLKELEEHTFRLNVIFTARFDRVSIERAERMTTLANDAVNKPDSDAARFLSALGDMAALKGLAAGVQGLEEAAKRDFSHLGESELMTFEDLMAIHLYTTAEFAPINQLMLFPEKFKGTQAQRQALQTKREFVENGLRKLPDYPREVYPLIRWENGNYNWRAVYRQGAMFQNKQFYSAGATDGASTGGGSIAVKLIIRVYGHSGKDIAMLSAAPGEGTKKSALPQPPKLGKGEVLFAPGASFLVISVLEGAKVEGEVQEVRITLIEKS